LSSWGANKHAVEAGLGRDIVSIHTLELELEAGRLVILGVEYFPILRHWYVLHRKGKRLLPIGEAFKEFVLSETPALISASGYGENTHKV